jgi:hypothetical protein
MVRNRRGMRRVRCREAASGCCSWDAGEASGVMWGRRGLLACMVDARRLLRLRGYKAMRLRGWGSIRMWGHSSRQRCLDGHER